ncbi:winged helix-turn-helix transcriptional regulator [Leisingera sp. HS039]|uniref:MarR family winged helix-turn-helix transcriptional regulator n=1 Tax=unclassified Leisingera TaxID=2614906 RepID=UPI0010713AA2|nr:MULTISPECIES: MarR family winged helix-turn-helix transcriptional regulator [unclassified Leisingera]MBQ4823706.1 winged helix-turn-helix transcriptional regulator [Leisingera sp. HS039]MCF6430064.1 MarR family winged helix-turn-helix transcriptional regulator [Leisingera sp. MMG026]QBR35930.1 MarR family transcriptional regulator [Leisingera sp. NJS201]
MKFEKQTSAGYLVNHTARLFAAGLQERITPLGITIGQFPILLELWVKDGVTQRELLEKLALEQATLANTLNRMERDGLIVRKKHPSDARSQQIWLTAAGQAPRDSAYQAANAQNEQSLAPLSKEEREQFKGLMRKIISAANKG